MKDTFYFSHDYNARQDSKIKKLLAKHGLLGYGIFWSLIEDLYNNANRLPTDYDCLAYDLRVDSEIIKSIVNDFDLFILENDYFGSLSIQKRIDERAEKSNVGKMNAEKRWGKLDSREKAKDCIFYILEFYSETERFLKCGITTESISKRYSGKTSIYKYDVVFSTQTTVLLGLLMENNISESFKKYTPNNKFGGYLECYQVSDKQEILDIANAKRIQDECKPNAIKERKGKETKIEFIIFWDLYGNKTGRKKSEAKWNKLNIETQQKIIDTLPSFLAYKPFEGYNHPNPETYLNNERWNDVLPTVKKIEETSILSKFKNQEVISHEDFYGTNR